MSLDRVQLVWAGAVVSELAHESKAPVRYAIEACYRESYRRWCEHVLATPALHRMNATFTELVAPDASAWGLDGAEALGIWREVRRARSVALARELRGEP